jgi:hypothetical protein
MDNDTTKMISTWVLPSCTFFFPLCWVLCFIDNWQVFISKWLGKTQYKNFIKCDQCMFDMCTGGWYKNNQPCLQWPKWHRHLFFAPGSMTLVADFSRSVATRIAKLARLGSCSLVHRGTLSTWMDGVWIKNTFSL